MANTPNKNNGRGRVVTPAPKTGAKGKSTPKTPKGKSTPKVTKASVLAHLATGRKANLTRGAKGFYTDKGAQRLATAIEKAHTLPSLTEAGIAVDKTRESAKARREFAKAHKATAVEIGLIVGEGKEGEITHDRPENTVRVRLASIAKAMGLANPEGVYYAIRTEAFAKGEVPKVYIVRR